MESQATVYKPLACVRCRSLKVKCIQIGSKQKCLKCTKSGHDCVVPTPRRQTATARRKPRLIDLDSKLNGIIAHLSGPKHDAGSSTTESISPRVDGSDSNARPQNQTPIGLAGLPVLLPSLISGEYSLPPKNHWASQLDLDVTYLDHLLSRFRTAQHFFPFVVIPEDWSASMMLDERPFLLLTAITTVARDVPPLQEVLAQEIKRTLARRVIVDCENNMDLLQGLLIHLAWFHHHLIPRSQQVYRILQIAISMIVDRGMHQVGGCRSDSSENDVQNSVFRTHKSAEEKWSQEAKRASLGCFYLSSMIASHMDKPNTLPLKDFALEVAEDLTTSAEFSSDRTLLPLLQLQRIFEDTRDTYGFDRTLGAVSRLQIHVERLDTNLEAWKRAIIQSGTPFDLFTTRYHAAKIRIHEMGLVYTFESRDPLSCTSPSVQTMLITNLAKSVDSIKAYLDYFLATDAATDNHLPLEEWLRFVLAFFAAYKLSINLREFPQWNVQYARETMDLENYMTLFINRFRSGQQGEDYVFASESQDIYSVLPDVLDSARSSFVVARDHPHQVHEGFRVHADTGSIKRTSTTTVRSNQRQNGGPAACPATGFWRTEAAEADSHWLTDVGELLGNNAWSKPSSNFGSGGMPGSSSATNNWSSEQLYADMGTGEDWFNNFGTTTKDSTLPTSFG